MGGIAFALADTDASADPAPGQATSNAAQAAGAGVNVYIKYRGQDVSDENNEVAGEVMVGHKVDVEVVVEAPPNQAVANVLWDVPLDTVKSYTRTKQKAEATELAANDLRHKAVTYYWVGTGGGSVGTTVKVSLVVGARAFARSTHFIVWRPGAALDSPTTENDPPVDVGPNDINPGETLHFGTRASPGITWNGSVQTPAIGAGEIAYVQLINYKVGVVENGARSAEASRGFILDDDPGADAGNPSYEAAVAIGNNDNKPVSSNDSPAMILIPELSAAGRIDEFKTYLVYKPQGADSIWVTLREVEWNWSGLATKDAQGNWQLAPGATSSKNPPSKDSSTLPTWDDYFSNPDR